MFLHIILHRIAVHDALMRKLKYLSQRTLFAMHKNSSFCLQGFLLLLSITFIDVLLAAIFIPLSNTYLLRFLSLSTLALTSKYYYIHLI